MTAPVEPARTPGIKGWLLRDLPYAAMLVLVMCSVALTEVLSRIETRMGRR